MLDFKLGLRMLVKHPMLTLVGGFAMAVGIAIGVGFFEFFHGMFNPDLPFDEGDRIVGLVNWDVEEGAYDRRTANDFLAWRDELQTVEDVSVTTRLVGNLVTSDGRVEPIDGAVMSAAAFRLTRIPPLLGRPLVESDEAADAPPVVVLGHDLWRARLNAAPTVLGQKVEVGGEVRTVVGVMPEGFAFPGSRNLWIPPTNLKSYGRREGPVALVVARLAPGVSLAEAQTELDIVGARRSAAYPETHEHLRPQALPFVESILVTEDPYFWWLYYGMQAFLLLVLLVAAVNVATLVFARTAAREAEIAVRSALGASRRRIVVQLFTESLVLSTAAAMVGLLTAQWAVRWGVGILRETQTMAIPFWWDDGLEPRTIAFVAFLTVLSAAVTGVLPALKVTGRRMQDNLRRIGAGSGGLRFGAASTVLVILQVAVSVGLLTYAVDYAGRTFKDQGVEAEFPADEYLSARLILAEEASAGRVLLEMERRVAIEPGFLSVAFADALPGTFPAREWIEVEGNAPGEEPLIHTVSRADVVPGYFNVLETQILAGRDFGFAEAAESSRVVIVNQAFVHQVLGQQAPIGRRVRVVPPGGVGEPGPWLEIVGVAGDLMIDPENLKDGAGMYRPATLESLSPVRMAARTGGDPQALAPRLRQIAAAVDPALQVREVKTLDRSVADAKTRGSFYLLASSLVTSMILLLAACSCFSLMSFLVSQRTREIGIRAALGADSRHILGAIFARAFVQLGAGVVVGLTAFVVLGGDVTTGRLGLLLSVGGLLVAGGLAACAVPVGRVLRIQPTEALREG